MPEQNYGNQGRFRGPRALGSMGRRLRRRRRGGDFDRPDSWYDQYRDDRGPLSQQFVSYMQGLHGPDWKPKRGDRFPMSQSIRGNLQGTGWTSGGRGMEWVDSRRGGGRGRRWPWERGGEEGESVGGRSRYTRRGRQSSRRRRGTQRDY